MKTTVLNKLALLILIMTPLPNTGICHVIIRAKELNENVVLTLTGEIDLAGTTLSEELWDMRGSLTSDILGSGLYLGPSEFIPVDTYHVDLSGPDTVGNVEEVLADAGTGTSFSIDTGLDEIQVPIDYQSGQPLSGETTFGSSNFESLGLIPGTYLWSWAGGNTFIAFIVGPADSPDIKINFSDNNLVFFWNAIPSAEYILESSSEFNTSWDHLQTIRAEKRNERISFPLPDSDHKFFRLRMILE